MKSLFALTLIFAATTASAFSDDPIEWPRSSKPEVWVQTPNLISPAHRTPSSRSVIVQESNGYTYLYPTKPGSFARDASERPIVIVPYGGYRSRY